VFGVAGKNELAVGAGYAVVGAAEMRGHGRAVDGDSAEDALDKGEADGNEDGERERGDGDEALDEEEWIGDASWHGLQRFIGGFSRGGLPT
jgi:hypothetical protein